MKKYYPLILTLVISVIAILSRFLPHPPNFTAIGAVALFSGVYLPRKLSFLIPLAIIFVTDIILGFYEPLVMASVYTSFAMVGFVGSQISKYKNFHTIFIGMLLASIIFFVITNFAVWAFTPWYAKTSAGLFSAYALAVPFFRNMLFGDIVYTTVLFGVFELALKIKSAQYISSLTEEKAMRDQ